MTAAPKPSFSMRRAYTGRTYVGTGAWEGLRFTIVQAHVKGDAVDTLTVRILSDSKRSEQRGEREEMREMAWLRSAMQHKLVRELGR